MKRELSIALSTIVMCYAIFTGCENRADVWDGTATKALSGSGIVSDPYRIDSAAELAYLASEVNSGNNYDGSYFSLERDIDLAGIEWTPIGDGINAFSGNFDGNGHTISNLCISSAVEYDKEYSFGASHQGTTGLFGYCRNASIYDLNIDSAVITANDSARFDVLYIGVLSGSYETDQSCEISNIHIDNASFLLNDVSGARLYAGGAVGYVNKLDSSDCNIDRIQTDILIDINADSSENSYKIADTYLGSIVGFLSSLGNIECSNLAGYMTALFPDYGNFYAGVLGCTQVSSQHSSEIKLNSVFSEVKVNRPPVVSEDNKFSSIAYAPYAIIGQVLQGKNPDGTCTSGGYEFRNLYGCVKPTDNNAGFSVPCYELYDLPEYAIYSETDCAGCESLPESCGFDTDIWNISDRNIPILK